MLASTRALKMVQIEWRKPVCNTSRVSDTWFSCRLQVRQQQQHQWMRRIAVDGERHRERDCALDRDLETKKVKSRATKGSRRDMPHSRYAHDLKTDRSSIGFAFGGVYPGRLHARGQLVDKHEVHFSVAKCGDYSLYAQNSLNYAASVLIYTDLVL